MKRSSADDEENGPPPKVQKILRPKHHRLVNVQPGSAFVLENPQNADIVSDQLTKGLAVALIEAGFDGAQPEALASLQAATEEYMTHFTHRIATSMRHCRRTTPLPQDFINALAAFNITPSSLLADIRLPTPIDITQAPILPPSPTSHTYPHDFSPPPAVTNSLDPPHEFRRPYVPKHLPPLPGTHSYKDTPVFASRETDARKIRERSTKEGMQAEQALRKLMAASKAGKLKKKRLETLEADQKWKKEEEAFRSAMDALVGDTEENSDRDKSLMSFASMDGAGDASATDANVDDEVEGGSFVNYERAYWRKSAVDHPLEVRS